MQDDYTEINFAFELFKTNDNIGKYNDLLSKARKIAGTTEGAEILIIRAMGEIYREFRERNRADAFLELYSTEWLLKKIEERLPVTQEKTGPKSPSAKAEKKRLPPWVQPYPKPSSVKHDPDPVDLIIQQICDVEFHRVGEKDSRSIRQMASHISDTPDQLIHDIVENIMRRPDIDPLDYKIIGSLANLQLRDMVKQWENDQWNKGGGKTR